MVETEKRFEELKKNLPLSNHFNLIPPPEFEGSGHVIRLYFNSLDELQSHRSVLAELIENDHFKKYWSDI